MAQSVKVILGQILHCFQDDGAFECHAEQSEASLRDRSMIEDPSV
jgi:hypothetical protein